MSAIASVERFLFDKDTVAYLLGALFTGALLSTLLRLKADKGKADKESTSASLRVRYIAALWFVSFADWMQGPQVYSIYEQNGWSADEIAKIYSTGYISGAVFGLFAGPLADTFGRKYVALLHPIAYGLGCASKYQRSFWLVILGRTLTGFANAVLSTVFEPWLVCEANLQGTGNAISGIISTAVTGNSFLAIVAGIITEFNRRQSMNQLCVAYMSLMWGLIHVVPSASYWLSILSLLMGFVVILSLWNQNKAQTSNYLQWRSGVTKHLKDPNVILIGLIQSFFEAAVYFFVFMWTPTLQISGIRLPHGLIFSSFMCCIMVGSNAFRVCIPTLSTKKSSLFLIILAMFASSCLYLPVFSKDLNVVFVGFLLFEFCCGLFWPLLGIMRARIYNDGVRSTIQTIFRIPFNTIVGFRLIFGNTKGDDVFTTASLMLAFSAFLATLLFIRLPHEHTTSLKLKTQ